MSDSILRHNLASSPTDPSAAASDGREPDWATVAPYQVAFGSYDTPTKCPVWGDKLPYKSITVIVDAADRDAAIHSCEYVHGGGAVSKTKKLPNGKLAIRANYMCW